MDFVCNKTKVCSTTITVFAVFIFLLLMRPVFAQVDIEKGKTLATTVCASCHGVDGNSPAVTAPAPTNPKLAGQHAAYLFKQIKDFKADKQGLIKRHSPIMMGFGSMLSDDDAKSVATYYSEQTLIPENASKKELKPIAEKLYRGGDVSRAIPACAGCHGPAGAGIPDQYPAIGGQFASYIQAQLLAYRSGTLTNDTEGVMRTISKYLSDKEIEALADYISGLRIAKK